MRCPRIFVHRELVCLPGLLLLLFQPFSPEAHAQDTKSLMQASYLTAWASCNVAKGNYTADQVNATLMDTGARQGWPGSIFSNPAVVASYPVLIKYLDSKCELSKAQKASSAIWVEAASAIEQLAARINAESDRLSRLTGTEARAAGHCEKTARQSLTELEYRADIGSPSWNAEARMYRYILIRNGCNPVRTGFDVGVARIELAKHLRR
jgi:hypothetical protein